MLRARPRAQAAPPISRDAHRFDGSPHVEPGVEFGQAFPFGVDQVVEVDVLAAYPELVVVRPGE
ncbi:hypothetical protein ACIA5D_46175 [Actinoplanes sp. NPDC051513]|uniref:hypothetical protein n=1 Tax=Actinoplanes sp. NPDC051513 TaxID=3363908 RepID=UPI00378D0F3E